MVRSLRLLTMLFVTAFAMSFPIAAAEDERAPWTELIGKPAPEISSDFALKDKPVKLADLKGKVVLLDFCAVWSAPCRECFPHLRQWNEKYKDKGLEIVGLTTYHQNWSFDKGTAKIVAAATKLTIEEEQNLLREYAAACHLTYRFQAAPQQENRTLYADYKVQQIPQMVVIDKKGIVRMIKVGSGEANAMAIEKTIKELLE